MANEMITLKLESSFLSEVDSIVRGIGYQSRTEFIRSVILNMVE